MEVAIFGATFASLAIVSVALAWIHNWTKSFCVQMVEESKVHIGIRATARITARIKGCPMEQEVRRLERGDA